MDDDGATLLEVLRDRLGLRSAKDGCSPQGQCGCCTVWIDGAARVSCVTPVRRVDGREVTTLEGLDPSLLSVWTDAFTRAGASQCGFCTPGIIMRLAALVAKKPQASADDVSTALAAHLCRCTGWRTILDAAADAQAVLREGDLASPPADRSRDMQAASRRAEVEGRSRQLVGPEVAAGFGGFADDSAPAGSLVAVPDSEGGWSVAGTLTEARRLSKKVQGRNSGARPSWPLEVPEGDWAFCLQTTFVEPAYLEPDSSWCEPGGDPASPVANGGAFGGKVHPVVTDVARTLAAEHGTAVRVLLSREDVVRLGPKRPPIAAGMRLDGTGFVRVARTPGSCDLSAWVESFTSYAPQCLVEVVDIAGPPVSGDARGAGWVEAAVLTEAVRASSETGGSPIASGWTAEASSPEGGRATVKVEDGKVRVAVEAGDVLDEVVLRSYCVGAVHQALGWVRREALAVDASGQVLDLTIRSFGILPAREMPVVEVQVAGSGGPAVNVSDAVFAATAASAWIGSGLPRRWPVSEVSARGASR
ncbi:MAG: 2Fe-2S iron-sulfur cluster-binding protein [Acidimicrobiales bacterium]